MPAKRIVAQIAVFEDRAERPGAQQPALGSGSAVPNRSKRTAGAHRPCPAWRSLQRHRCTRSCCSPGRASAGRIGGNDPRRDAGRKPRDRGNLIEKDMRGPGSVVGVSTSKRRQSGSSSTDSAAFSATSRWNSGKAPSTSSKATVIAKAGRRPCRSRPVVRPSSSPRPPALSTRSPRPSPVSKFSAPLPLVAAARIGGVDQGVSLEIVLARGFRRHAALEAIEEMPAGPERALLRDMPGMAGPRQQRRADLLAAGVPVAAPASSGSRHQR